MVETNNIGFHWLIIVIAILLGTQMLPRAVHAEPPLSSVEEAKDNERAKFSIKNNDVVNTTDERVRPNVLVRYIHSIDGSSVMGIRMKDDMHKATESTEGGIRDALILSSGCQMISKEDYGSSEFGNWMVDPSEFDFVVTNTIEGYTRDSEFFEFNQPIQLTETWEVKKGLDTTISKKWQTSFEFLVDTGLIFEPEDFQESAPMLLTTVVSPRRGPILKEICRFIHEHSK